VGRSPGDDDSIVPLHLVKEDIDASDNVFVCDRINRFGRKQFKTITPQTILNCGEDARSRDLRRFRIQSRAW